MFHDRGVIGTYAYMDTERIQRGYRADITRKLCQRAVLRCFLITYRGWIEF